MTPADLDAIRARLAAVPAPPWKAYCYEGPAHPPPKGWHSYSVCRDVDEEDHVCVTTALAKNEERAELVAEFVAHSRADIEDLAAEVVSLRGALDAVAALLFVPLRDLGYDRAAEVLCAHVEELYQQRSAARNEEYAHAAAYARADALQAKVATLTQERDEARAERRAARLDRDAAEERLAALVRGGDRG